MSTGESPEATYFLWPRRGIEAFTGSRSGVKAENTPPISWVTLVSYDAGGAVLPNKVSEKRTRAWEVRQLVICGPTISSRMDQVALYCSRGRHL